jgi:hypothetical protein
MRNFVHGIAQNYRNQPLLNTHAFTEFAYYHPRKKMVSGILSVASLMQDDLDLDEDTRSLLWDFICKSKHSQFLLWEGIVPYCLAEFWALSNIQGTNEPDRRLFALTKDILNSNNHDDDEAVEPRNLPGPYYSLTEVVRWRYKLFLQNFRSDIDRDSHYRRSWFAEPLFFLLARRNYKLACQLLWPDLTRFVHVSTQIPNAFDFGPAKCEGAVAEDKLIDLSRPKTWEDITVECATDGQPLIPRQLLLRPALVLLYCLFVPQRMNREIILWLDRAFCKTWY